MTVGTCMKDVCDKRKVPRQALAYIIDSTGAPVCALIPFSTWVVFIPVFYSGTGHSQYGLFHRYECLLKSASLYVLSHGCTSGCHSVCLQTDAKARKMKDAYTDLEKKEQTPEHPKCTMPLPLTLPWPE